LDFADRIRLQLAGSERMLRVAKAGEAQIKRECLVDVLSDAPAPDATEHSIGEETLRISITKV
jgi:hypothetical protein